MTPSARLVRPTGRGSSRSRPPDSRGTLRTVGWSLLGAGVALPVGAAVYMAAGNGAGTYEDGFFILAFGLVGAPLAAGGVGTLVASFLVKSPEAEAVSAGYAGSPRVPPR